MKDAQPKKFEKRHIFAGIVPTQVLPELHGKRYVLIGEAAGLTDPISYHGIYNSIRSARLAATLMSEAITLEKPEKLKEYSDAVLSEIYHADIEYAKCIAKTLYGHELADKLADAVLRLAKTDSELREALTTMLHHKTGREKPLAILRKKKSKILKRFGIFESFKLSRQFLTGG